MAGGAVYSMHVMEEFLSREKEIVARDKLKVKLVALNLMYLSISMTCEMKKTT
jgi:hypothetical protein